MARPTDDPLRARAAELADTLRHEIATTDLRVLHKPGSDAELMAALSMDAHFRIERALLAAMLESLEAAAGICSEEFQSQEQLRQTPGANRHAVMLCEERQLVAARIEDEIRARAAALRGEG